MATALGAASLLRLAGADAIAFAHAQFSSNLLTLAPGQCGWSAWLDAQGRVRALFAVLRVADDALLVWQPLGAAMPLALELRRYLLRSRVRIEPVEGWQVLELPAPALPADTGHWLDHHGGHALRLPDGMARGVALLPADHPIDAEAALAWRRQDIAARLPWIGPATAGRFVPQALELERIGALSFDKGCYPGQEIVARLHFRGGNKRGLRVITTGAQLPEPGTTVPEPHTGRAAVVLYGVPAQRHGPAQVLAVAEVGVDPAAAGAGQGAA